MRNVAVKPGTYTIHNLHSLKEWLVIRSRDECQNNLFDHQLEGTAEKSENWRCCSMLEILPTVVNCHRPEKNGWVYIFAT